MNCSAKLNKVNYPRRRLTNCTVRSENSRISWLMPNRKLVHTKARHNHWSSRCRRDYRKYRIWRIMSNYCRMIIWDYIRIYWKPSRKYLHCTQRIRDCSHWKLIYCRVVWRLRTWRRNMHSRVSKWTILKTRSTTLKWKLQSIQLLLL